MSDLSALIQQISRGGGVNVHYQPIFEIVDGKLHVFSVEGFSRGPKGSEGASGRALFDYVRRQHREVEIDRACVAAVFSALYLVARMVPVTINVHATTIERDHSFTDFLLDVCRFYKIRPSDVIVDLVEYQKIVDHCRFTRNVGLLKVAGIQVSIDDIAHTRLEIGALIEINADFYKIDAAVAALAYRQSESRAAIETISLVANRAGARVVAESVESSADLDAVNGLGVTLAQGFHLAAPLPATDLMTFLTRLKSGDTDER